METKNLISNRYLIVKHIGKGGMADVYVAIDKVLNREVAIKILKGDLSHDEVSLERFRREANASTCLSHPNIVDIYDVGDDGDKHYIVMEYIKGQSLKQLIRKRGPIPYKETVSIMRQLCSAIMEAHRNGIIHRDIKSQNVLIKDDGTAKVVDFGIAIAANAMQITGEDSVLGSVHYMAPELTKGETASMQSDIYSLGIVFYELLTSKLPFDGDSAAKIILESFKKPTPSVKRFDADIPQSIENIIIKATAKNRLNRYQTVSEMLKDLNECLDAKHLNDKKVHFENKEEISLKPVSEEKVVPKKKAKAYSQTLLYIFFVLAAIVGTFSIAALCYFGGLFGNYTRQVEIPNIINMTTLKASDILDEKGLSLDLSNIERELTDNVEAGLIIRVYPEVGLEVEQGTSIKVVVSDGIAEVMPDFVGQSIDEVKAYLAKYPNIIIRSHSVASDYESGTVVEQKGILADGKFDPNRTATIELYYSEYNSVILPFGIVGADIDNATAMLDALGVKYEMKALDLTTLTEEQFNELKNHTIYSMSPSEGTSYSQTSSSIVKLIYVEIYE